MKALCFLIGTFLATTAFAQNITSGLWKAKTKITIAGMTMPLFDVDDCISSNEAKDIKKYIQENLIPETQCTVKTWNYKKPDLKVTLSCENSQYNANGNLSGKVTDKEFKIGGTLHGTHVAMGSVNVGVDYTGTYTKACK